MKKALSTQRASGIIGPASFITIASLVFSACNDAPAPQPKPKIEVTIVSGTAQAIEPQATSTPRPLGNPVLVDRSPVAGEELQPDQPLVLTFDQPMDRASVESAVFVTDGETRVAGTFDWRADNVVAFTPSGASANGWNAASQYAISLKDSAKSAKGLGLARAQDFVVSTIGNLAVAQTIPTEGAANVTADTRITVLFNRPVVPLTTLAQQQNLPVPLTFDPPIAGTGTWLNTSIYMFVPSQPLVGGTRYRGIVAAGLKDSTGAVLQNEFSWSFSAAAPLVKSIAPTEAQFDVDLREPISVTFSQKMDHASAEAAFSIVPSVPGKFVWVDEAPPRRDRFAEPPQPARVGPPPDTASLGEVMAFVPEADYARATQYRVKIATDAKAAIGDAALGSEFLRSFNTIANVGIKSTTPVNNATRIDNSDGVRIQFTAPVAPETIIPNLKFEPAISLTNIYTYYSDYDKSFYLNGSLAPSTNYVLTIGKGIGDKYGQTLTEPVLIKFTTAPLRPFVALRSDNSIGTYNATLPTQLFVSYRNVTQLDFVLAKLSLEEFGQFAGPNGYEMYEKFVPAKEAVLREWSAPTEAGLNEFGLYKAQMDENGGALQPGVYLLSVSAPELAKLDTNYRPQKHVMIVSALHLTFKRGERQLLLWATGLRSGQAQPGLNVSFRDKDFKEIGTAVSSAEAADFGQAWASFDAPFRPYDPLFAVVAQPGDPLFGIIHSEMANGINPYDYNLSARFSNDPYYAHIYTDRPVYRPGQMVFFKGIARVDNDARYSIPSPDQLPQVNVTVNSPQGQLVFSSSLALNANGTFSGAFALDNAAATGSYYLQACLPTPPRATQTLHGEGCSFYGIAFLVATYRRPEFEAGVTLDKADYKAGETINATIEGRYFSGGNVQGAKVQWTLTARDYIFDRYRGPGNYSFGDFDFDAFYNNRPGFSQFTTSGEGVTDASGKLQVRVPADIGTYKGSAQFTLEASVVDVNDQAVSARADAIIHKGALYFGIAPASYVVNVGATLQANVISVDWQGQPVPNQTATVTFYQRQWFAAQEEDQFGNTIFTSVPSDTEVFSQSIATAAAATATVSFVPSAGGEYRIVVTSGDVRAATSSYVSSNSEYVAWRVNNNDRIDLRADKAQYEVGETARILVPSPFAGSAVALLTVERGNFLLRKTITLNSNSDVLEIPIEESYAPNAFVSVLIASTPTADAAPAFKLGYATFSVNAKAFALNVQITPDKAQYGPRDTATYDLRVTNADGNPVQAEVSVAVVDKAVLSLTDPNSGKLLDSFYGLRGLSVRTADTLSVNVDRITSQIAAEAKKGGGGGGDAASATNFTRRNFKDTAYWTAVVNTDAAGQARISVILPDNLTTWVLEARAVTSDTKVGEGKNEVLSTKPLLLRPVTPRFFVVGDEAVVGAVLNNNTGSDIQADVSLQVTGVELRGGAATQQVSVKANGTARVDWSVRATNALTWGMVFTAQGGGFADSVEVGSGLASPLSQAAGGGLPILRYASPETVATAGAVSEPGQKLEVVALPPRLETGMGALSIHVDSSLAAASAQGLKALDEYPYESTDWVACRLMANVANARFMKLTGLGDQDGLRAKLDGLVARALQRLYVDQHSDGGWGWWINDESNVTLSAIVLSSMAQAQEAGYGVDANAIARAQEFLRSKLRTAKDLDTSDANRQTFILFALAQSSGGGAGDSGHLGALFDVRDNLSHYAKALLAMSMAKLNAGDTRIKTLLSDIQSAAITSATGLSWQENTRDWENFYAATRSTSIVLAALARLDPQNGLAPNAVRWLMTARKTDAWESVQENAWAVTALADWMIASGEVDTHYDWRVTVNDAQVLQGKATRENLAESGQLRIEVAQLLQGQANQVVIERGNGAGRLYYTAQLQAFLPVEDVKAANRGIVMARKYESADCEAKPAQPCPAISSAKVGENVRVRLTIVAPSSLYYVTVTDPFPAGTEAVDTSLKTSQSVNTAPQQNEFGGLYGWGWWWFSHTELRDEKAALFATYLPAGTYEYTYVLRPSIVGNYKVMPAVAEQTYFPEVFGRSDGGLFTVTR